MLANLLAAHLVRFKLSWKRAGIILIHSGVALMLLGEWVTREQAVEQRMSIDKGAGTNYAEDTRNYELAIVDVTDPDDQTAAVVPFPLVKAGGVIRDEKLPVDVEVVRVYENAGIVRRARPHSVGGIPIDGTVGPRRFLGRGLLVGRRRRFRRQRRRCGRQFRPLRQRHGYRFHVVPGCTKQVQAWLFRILRKIEDSRDR